MNQIMNGEPLTIFGDGSQTRAFSYIDDVAPYIAQSVNCPQAYNEIFNIGADTPYSVRYLAEVVCRSFDVEPQLQFEPPRNEVLHTYSDHEKARRVLGVGIPVGLDEGIHRMAAWAKLEGARKSHSFENIEITKT